MEGLKIIAQSTFDKHQKFRAATRGSHRYSVIEIGAFGSPPPSSSNTTSATKGQPTDGVQNVQSAPEADASSSRHEGATDGAIAGSTDSGPSRASFNEWAVYEDDLAAFMKKRPVELVASVGKRSVSQPLSAETDKGKGPVHSGSAATSTTGHSRSVSLQSSKTAYTSSTTATTATTGTSPGKLTRKPASKGEEVEAGASLKLICVPRAAPDDGDSDADTNTLAISREAFLRLYVDTMDADHGALYFLARGYDGFHEYNDPSKSTVTYFIGTEDYVLVWTFLRLTLETRGLFIDRKRPGQPKDPEKNTFQNSISTSKRSAKRDPLTSNAWLGFRDMLRMYKSYIYAPRLFSFVSSLHLLHVFDDQVSAHDVPQIKEIERKIGNGTKGSEEEAEHGNKAVSPRPSLQAVSRQSSVQTIPISTGQSFISISPEASKPPDNGKLITWAQTSGEITDRVSHKLRQLKMAKEILNGIAREHETVIADVVAPNFLDRYHWAMEGLNEAIPVVEGHMASLEESMRDLKARTERLYGLVCCLYCLQVAACHPSQGKWG